MTKENFNTIIRAFTITVATIISIGLAVLTLSGKVAPWTGRFYSLLDPSYAKNNIPIIGNVKLLSIRFSFCTLGGASKLFVYKQSSPRSKFAKNLISIDFQHQFSTNVARFARRYLTMDFVTQFSANETRFARRKSNFFHRFVTSIFNKRSSLCSQKSNLCTF